MKTRHRLLAALLALIMLVGLLSASAFAADDPLPDATAAAERAQGEKKQENAEGESKKEGAETPSAEDGGALPSGGAEGGTPLANGDGTPKGEGSEGTGEGGTPKGEGSEGTGEGGAPAQESPAPDPAPAPAAPIQVVFVTAPEGAELQVYPPATEDDPEPEPIAAEADGSWLLPPGDYVYTARAEGYVSLDKTAFTVAAPEEGGPLTVSVTLAEAESTAEPAVETLTAMETKKQQNTRASDADRYVNSIPPVNGGYLYVDEIKWRVIGYTGYNYLLLSDEVLGGTRSWSDAQSYCSTVYNGFSEQERAAVHATSKTDSAYTSSSGLTFASSTLSAAPLFLLSAAEAETYLKSDAARQPGGWWLRSPLDGNVSSAGAVLGGGSVGSGDAGASGDFGARPAFQLDLSLLLFESAAQGAKSVAVQGGGSFEKLSSPSGAGGDERKMTLIDENRPQVYSFMPSGSRVTPGGSVTLSYWQATKGDRVSTLLMNEAGEFVYYASRTATSSQDTWVLTLPTDLTIGESYDLLLFSEEQHGDFQTDYVSRPIFFSLTVLPTVTVSVAASPDEGGRVSGGGTVISWSSVTVRATPKPGYRFVNWTENGTEASTDADYTFTATADHDLIANFAPAPPVEITVAANPGEGGTVSGGGTVNLGSPVTVTAASNAGYRFVNWTENGTVVSTAANYTFITQGNHNLTANFAPAPPVEITVAASPGEGGTVSGGRIYGKGDAVTVRAAANTGYRFVNWTENGAEVSTKAAYTFTADENRDLTANFASAPPVTVTVTASPDAGGTVSGGGTLACSSSFTVTATAKPGYNFVNWTENGTQVSDAVSYTFTADRDRDLTANFSQLPTVKITVTVSPEEGGTVIGGGTYTVGSTVDLKAVPNPGYHVGTMTWNGVTYNASGHRFVAELDRDYVVTFERNMPTEYALINDTPPADGLYVWMGGDDPVLWHIIGENANNRLLLSADKLLSAGKLERLPWSELKDACETVLSGFSAVESSQNVIPLTQKSEPDGYEYWTDFSLHTFGPSSVDGQIFVLSVEEVCTYLKGMDWRGSWWTRSPRTGPYSDPPHGVVAGTNWFLDKHPPGKEYFRPALQLNRGPVLLESAAEGGKSSATPGSGAFGTLSGPSGTGKNEIKLTLIDDGRSSFTADVNSASVAPGGRIAVKYEGVPSGDCVSALLLDDAGNILYYASKTPDGTGVWEMTIPDTRSGSYTLQLFSEEQNGDKKSDYASPPVSFSLSVTAPVTVTATASPTEGGTVSGGGTYSTGEAVTVTASLRTGYRFVNWTENGTEVSTKAAYTFTAAADRDLIANFVKIYTVDVAASPTEGGTVSGGGTYDAGEAVTVTAAAKPGYRFVNWTENGTEVSPDAAYTFTAAADRNLIANFVLETYTVTVTASPTEGGTVSGGGTVDTGEAVTVRATPNTGYRFVNWTENGAEVSTSADYTFIAAADRDLTANFVLETYTITYDLGGGKLNGKTGTVTVDATYGSTIILPKPEREGYDFDYWKGSRYEAGESYTVKGDHTLTAQWIKQSNKVKTGDDRDPGLWLGLTLLSGFGLLAAAEPILRRGKGRYTGRHCA